MRSVTSLIPLLLLGGSQPCLAPTCECVPSATPEAAYASAARVFTGRILRVDTIEAVFDSGAVRRHGYEVRFAVLQSWKGATQDTVAITTFNTCARFFDPPTVGTAFLVYAARWREPARVRFVGGHYGKLTRPAEPLVASACGRSSPIDSAEADLRWLSERHGSGH